MISFNESIFYISYDVGKDGNTASTTTTKDLVLQLAQPILHKGHCLWMDNFFNSIPLSEELRQAETASCGTIRLSRKGIPKVKLLFKI